MKILFAGSPDIAVPSLKVISELECAEAPGQSKIQLAGVLTNMDSAQGRKSDLVPTEVSVAASALSKERVDKGFSPIKQLKYNSLGSDAREQAALLECDLLVCFAYGRIFGPKFLSLFPKGGINIHPSLLPRFRGPSPIAAAILAGDMETGISIQTIAAEMDSGLILSQEKIPLSGRETSASLNNAVAIKAAQMLKSFIPVMAEGAIESKPQIGEPLYCKMIAKEDGHLVWSHSAVKIDAMVRAYNPWPLCYTGWRGENIFFYEGRVFDNIAEDHPVHKMLNKEPGFVLGTERGLGILIQTGHGVYAVSRVQRQAKRVMDWKDFLNGNQDFIGSFLK